MATSGGSSSNNPPPRKPEWLIILPDQADAFPRRMQVRSEHLTRLQPTVDSGFWTLGGAFLERQPREDDKEPPKLTGSVMLASADTREEVLEALKRDVYSTSEVWDWNKVEIFPFRTAIRKEI